MDQDRITLYILAFLLIVAIVWAYLTTIDVSIEARGMVRPEGDVIHVSSEIGGRIMDVHGKEGDWVHAGDALIQLDTREIDLKLRSLENQIHATELLLEQLRRSESESSNLSAPSISAAHLKLLGLYEEQERTRLHRTQLTIASPADGRLDAVTYHSGEVLGQGAAVATVIPSDRNLIVESWVPARDRSGLHEGQAVRLQPEDPSTYIPGPLDGSVASVSPDVRQRGSTVSYRVVTSLLQESPTLRPGMTFRVHFLMQRDRLLLLLFHRLHPPKS